MKYSLKDDGYTWHVIYHGRNKVGRVWQHAETKVFHGMIGKSEATGTSFVDAFRNVAAKALGYDSVHDLHNHNSRVKLKRRLMKHAADLVVDEMLKGNYEPFGEVLKHPDVAVAMVGPMCNRILKV